MPAIQQTDHQAYSVYKSQTVIFSYCWPLDPYLKLFCRSGPMCEDLYHTLGATLSTPSLILFLLSLLYCYKAFKGPLLSSIVSGKPAIGTEGKTEGTGLKY